jgi:hypothetical protein
MKFILILLALVVLLLGGAVAFYGDRLGDLANSLHSHPPTSDFPQVAGRYAYSTDEIAWTCSNGTAGTAPADAGRNFTVKQDENRLTLKGEKATVAGAQVLEHAPSSGLIHRDGTFMADSSAIMTLEGIEGKVTVRFLLKGKFSADAWSGTFEYDTIFAAGNCRYLTNFQGEKL